MATLADIEANALAFGAPFEDDSTPAGHFGIMAMMDGFTATYLLEGGIDDFTSVIKGRIVLDTTGTGPNTVYVNGNLRGGSFSVHPGTFKDAFAKMV